MKKIFILMGILASVPTVGFAQWGEGKLEFGGFAGQEFFSNQSRADDDFVVGFRAGYRFGEKYQVELVYDFVDTNETLFHGIIEEVETLSANFLWNYWESANGRASAYGTAGVGNIDVTVDTTELSPSEIDLLTQGWVPNLPKFDNGMGMMLTQPGSFNDSDTVITLGAGMRVFLKPRVGIRYEVRAKDYEVFQVSATDLELTVGFTITTLGGKN